MLLAQRSIQCLGSRARQRTTFPHGTNLPLRLLSHRGFSTAPHHDAAHEPSKENGHTSGAEHQDSAYAAGDASSHGHEEHGHGGIEGAQHQVTHRIAEKTTFGMLERVAERLTGAQGKKVMQHVGSKMVQNVAERAAERAGEKAAAKAGLKAAEHAIEKLGERAGERLVERLGERLGERVGERVGERMAERMAERVGERVAERVGERVAERVGERVGERVAERMGERVGERLGQRVGTKALARGGMAATERIVEQSATRGETAAVGALAMHSMNPAERLMGGRLKRFFSPALLSRIGRGAMVALPAIGALFVAHLAKQDFERMMEERSKRNVASCVMFALAFVFDLADVLAHIVVVTGLLHEHFAVGMHVSHALMHSVEGSGIAIAVVSTVSAAAAELLSIGAHHGKAALHQALHHGAPHEQQPLQAQPQAAQQQPEHGQGQ